MDFKSPPRDYQTDYNPRPYRAPIATVPPPVELAREEPAPKKRRLKRPAAAPKNWKKITIAIVLIGLIAWLMYGYITTKNQLEQQKGTGGPAQTQTQQLINKVGQLVDLPQGESPTIATVNDASKLKNQQFFANAQNGDKVLIFSKSGMAVLYRPSTNKIIEYSKVNLSSGT